MGVDMFRHWKSFPGVVCLLSLCFQLGVAQQRTGSLRGHVSDEIGALIVGATITFIAAGGTKKTAAINSKGTYNFNSLPPGPYTIRVASPGFSQYEKTDLTIG